MSTSREVPSHIVPKSNIFYEDGFHKVFPIHRAHVSVHHAEREDIVKLESFQCFSFLANLLNSPGSGAHNAKSSAYGEP